MNMYTFVTSKVNTVKLCDTNALSQGCSPSSSIALGEVSESGFTMHNGASVAGFNGGLSNNEFVVDWNGLNGANDATEQIRLAMNFTTDPDWLGVRKCTIAPKNTETSSVALFQDVFAR